VLEASISSTLLNINFSWNDLSGVPPKLLAAAMCRLRNLNLSCSRLTVDQCVQILEASLSSTTLVYLQLTGVDLSGVPPDLLARAVSRLKMVNLSSTRLTVNQCAEILMAIPSSTTLTNVNLKYVNLKGVPPDILAKAVHCLQTINLAGTALTADQCLDLLDEKFSSSKLVNLNLRFVNLNAVPPHILARAVSHLQTVDLHGTSLTPDQCLQLLEASLSSTTLANVDFSYVDLSEVPPDLLAKSVTRLSTVNLSNFNNLTTDQCVAVLSSILSSSTLVTLNLTHVRLHGVPPDLLAKAVGRHQSVDLTSTKLSTQQMVQVLKAVISSTTLTSVKLIGNGIRDKLPGSLRYLLTALPSYVQV